MTSIALMETYTYTIFKDIIITWGRSQTRSQTVTGPYPGGAEHKPFS